MIWDYEIQTDHLILARKPDLVSIRRRRRRRRTCCLVEFTKVDASVVIGMTLNCI